MLIWAPMLRSTELAGTRGFFLSARLVKCQQLCATWFTTVITTAITVPLLNLRTEKVQVSPQTWTRSLKVSHLWSVRYVKSGPRVVPPQPPPPPHTYTVTSSKKSNLVWDHLLLKPTAAVAKGHFSHIVFSQKIKVSSAVTASGLAAWVLDTS